MSGPSHLPSLSSKMMRINYEAPRSVIVAISTIGYYICQCLREECQYSMVVTHTSVAHNSYRPCDSFSFAHVRIQYALEPLLRQLDCHHFLCT
jgi:hypothetical protein